MNEWIVLELKCVSRSNEDIDYETFKEKIGSCLDFSVSAEPAAENLLEHFVIPPSSFFCCPQSISLFTILLIVIKINQRSKLESNISPSICTQYYSFCYILWFPLFFLRSLWGVSSFASSVQSSDDKGRRKMNNLYRDLILLMGQIYPRIPGRKV